MKQTVLILMAMLLAGCVTYDWKCSRCRGDNTVVGFGTIRCIKCGKILPDDKKLEAKTGARERARDRAEQRKQPPPNAWGEPGSFPGLPGRNKE